jgi:catechol-2,3-dioxygenase
VPSPTEDLEYVMRFEGVVMNVTDLTRSIDFYREVLGFTLLTQNDQLATLSAPGSEDPQVIVLRAFGTGRLGGARHTGLRAFVLEVESIDDLERIAGELESRGLLVSRRDQGEWTAVVGRDLDGVAVVMASVLGGGRITTGHWTTLDDLLYGIGE